MPLVGTSDYKRKWQGEKSCIWFNLGYLKWHLSYSQRVGIYVADPSIQEQEKTNITHLYTLFSVMNSTHWYAPGPVAGSTLLIYGSIVILGWKTVKQPLFSLEKMQAMPQSLTGLREEEGSSPGNMDQFTHWEAHLLQSRANIKVRTQCWCWQFPGDRAFSLVENRQCALKLIRGHLITSKIRLSGFLRDNGESFV